MEQWKRELLKWTSELEDEQIITLTSKTEKKYQYNPKNPKPIVVISHYTFLAAKLPQK